MKPVAREHALSTIVIPSPSNDVSTEDCIQQVHDYIDHCTAAEDLFALAERFKDESIDISLLREVDGLLFEKGTALDMDEPPTLQEQITKAQDAEPGMSKSFEAKEGIENALGDLISQPLTPSLKKLNGKKEVPGEKKKRKAPAKPLASANKKKKL